MGFVSDRFNLEKQMTFYLSYHDNKINQAIHLLCIWPIFISGIMILAHTDKFAETPDAIKALPYGQYAVLNWSVVMAVIYMAWYIALDAIAGSLGAAIVLASYLFGNYFVEAATSFTDVPSIHVAVGIHATAWILQFIGHGVFERRKPALFDSLDQALITAPMFVLLEILFPLGYRSELYARVSKQAKLNVKAFQATGKTL